MERNESERGMTLWITHPDFHPWNSIEARIHMKLDFSGIKKKRHGQVNLPGSLRGRSHG